MTTLLESYTKPAKSGIPTRVKTFWPKLVMPAVFLTVTLFIQFPQWDWINIDGSVFWYEGQQILRGKIPYRDIWDHKPPLIYYYDALLLLVFPAKIEILHLSSLALAWATTLFFYTGVKKCVRVEVAIMTGLLFTFYLNLPQLNNGFFYTENLQVFLLSVAFYCFIRWYQQTETRYLLLTGLFCGLALITKQTEPGLVVLTLIVIIKRKLNIKQLLSLDTFRQLLSFGLPLLLPAALFASYFYFVGAWSDFIDQNLTYNRIYVTQTSLGTILASSTAVSIFQLPTLVALLPLILVQTITPLLNRKSRQRFLERNPFGCLPTIWIGLDWIAVNLSGRGYEHYCLQLIIPLSFAGAFLLNDLWNFWVSNSKRPVNQTKIRASICIILFCLFSIFTSFTILQTVISIYGEKFEALQQPGNLIITGNQSPGSTVTTQVSNYLRNEGGLLPNEQIYVWGRGAQITFLTGTNSPTKFIYNAPLTTPGYSSIQAEQQLLQALQTSPPQFFIDTGFPEYLLNSDTKLEPNEHLDNEFGRYEFDSILKVELQSFLKSSYTLQKVINPATPVEVLIYRLKSN